MCGEKLGPGGNLVGTWWEPGGNQAGTWWSGTTANAVTAI